MQKDRLDYRRETLQPSSAMSSTTVELEQSIAMESLGNADEFSVAFSPRKDNNRRSAYQATREYKDKFASILTETFEDEESWCLAAEAVLKQAECAVKVCHAA